MMDLVIAQLVDVLATQYPISALLVPAGVATPLAFMDTTDLIDERDPAALCRIDAQDGFTMQWPMESPEQNTLTVGYTITLRRADLPALATLPVQGMRRAALRCAEALCHALIVGMDGRVHLEANGVVVRTPSDLTINEPDTDVDAAVTSVTVTAVHPIEPRWILARSP